MDVKLFLRCPLRGNKTAGEIQRREREVPGPHSHVVQQPPRGGGALRIPLDGVHLVLQHRSDPSGPHLRRGRRWAWGAVCPGVRHHPGPRGHGAGFPGLVE